MGTTRVWELQAAILRVQLPHLDEWAAGRRAAGACDEAAGLGELVSLPRPTDGLAPAWHLFVVRSDRADGLAAAFTTEGIGNKAYYRTPIHRQPAMREFAPDAELPATDEAARTHLAISIGPVLTADQARTVYAVARRKLGRIAA